MNSSRTDRAISAQFGNIPAITHTRSSRSATRLPRLARDPFALLSTIFLVVIILVALLADWISPYPPNAPDYGHSWELSSSRHWLGTDGLARDVLARILHGARASLLITSAVLVGEISLGLIAGLIAGYFRGLAGALLMRLADGLLAFPGLLLVLVLSAVMGPGPPALILGLTLLGWPMIARLVCNETLRLAQRDFVPAARAIGAGNTRILLRHILPNTLRPVLAMVPLLATIIMLAEASLSFLGLGVQPPLPSWGSLIRDMTPRLQTHLPLLLYPAAALSLTIVALNYLAEWVQDRLDPISRFR